MTNDEDLWSDEICAFVDAAFETVGRNPSDHEEAIAYRRAILAALCQPTQSDAMREAVIGECAKALEADAKLCDCFARNEGECGCGAWCEWKSITSQRAIEIVRAVATPPE